MASASRYPDIGNKLVAEFHPQNLRSFKKSGKPLTYVTLRTIENRLDEIFGWDRWKNEVEIVVTKTTEYVVCKLWIQLDSGEWIFKMGIGGKKPLPEENNAIKSAHTDAMKNAAVRFGLGRYLYGEGVLEYQDEEYEQEQYDSEQPVMPIHQPNGSWPLPESGRRLFNEIQKHEVDLATTIMPQVLKWAKENRVNGKMVDWTKDQVRAAWIFADEIVARYRPQEAKSKFKPEQRRCWESAKSYLKTVYDGEEPSNDSITKCIQDNYAHLYPGEVIESLREFRDYDRLNMLSDHFDKDRAAYSAHTA